MSLQYPETPTCTIDVLPVSSCPVMDFDQQQQQPADDFPIEEYTYSPSSLDRAFDMMKYGFALHDIEGYNSFIDNRAAYLKSQSTAYFTVHPAMYDAALYGSSFVFGGLLGIFNVPLACSICAIGVWSVGAGIVTEALDEAGYIVE